jgi:hypothetical protein
MGSAVSPRRRLAWLMRSRRSQSIGLVPKAALKTREKWVLDGVGLEVEQLHPLDGLAERSGHLGRRLGALAGTADESEQAGNGGMEKRRGFGHAAGDQAEDLLEGRGWVGDGEDRVRSGGEHSTHLFQARTFDPDPEHLPRIGSDGAMFVRMVAVDPGKFPGIDAVGHAFDTHVTGAADAINELMAGEMLTADVVVRAANHVPGAGYGVKDVLVHRVGGGVQRDREPRSHSRIVQLFRTIRHCEGGLK